MKYPSAWRPAMHFHIDTADFMPLFLMGFCAVNCFSKAQVVRSQTRSQYCSLASCVCSCIGFPAILGEILSDKPTLLTVQYFPDRIPGNFKRFDTQLAAFVLTTLLPSNLTLTGDRRHHIGFCKAVILRRDVDRQKQPQVKVVHLSGGHTNGQIEEAHHPTILSEEI
jgi:hypothetical protein